MSLVTKWKTGIYGESTYKGSQRFKKRTKWSPKSFGKIKVNVININGGAMVMIMTMTKKREVLKSKLES